MRHPVGTFVEFELGRPVASSKNRRRLFARGRRVMSLPSEQAVADTEMIQAAATKARPGGALLTFFHEDDSLELTYSHDIRTDTLTVRVTKIGELPAKGKRGTKRDVHGMMETIADALQGTIYPNDSAVDVFGGRRVR